MGTVRCFHAVSVLLALSGPVLGQVDRPKWFDDPKEFCATLATRANGKSTGIKVGSIAPPFGRYGARPIKSPRRAEVVIGKYDWQDQPEFTRELRAEAAKGPDFAGRYAVILWSCGTECSNAIL